MGGRLDVPDSDIRALAKALHGWLKDHPEKWYFQGTIPKSDLMKRIGREGENLSKSDWERVFEETAGLGRISARRNCTELKYNTQQKSLARDTSRVFIPQPEVLAKGERMSVLSGDLDVLAEKIKDYFENNGLESAPKDEVLRAALSQMGYDTLLASRMGPLVRALRTYRIRLVKDEDKKQWFVRDSEVTAFADVTVADSTRSSEPKGKSSVKVQIGGVSMKSTEKMEVTGKVRVKVGGIEFDADHLIIIPISLLVLGILGVILR